jgi:hypothetical protein
VPGSNNFQFEKPIPGGNEVMRIEFMAPAEYKRDKDFRVDVEKGIHAHACTGGSVALAESSLHPLSGKLPGGSAFSASVRVTEPHALVMLKLIALDERYRNIRGPEEARHDREEARTHAADSIAIVSGQAALGFFRERFEKQFRQDLALGVRVLKILDSYFRRDTSPGLLVYEEFIVADKPLDRSARLQVNEELRRAHQMILKVFPPAEFYVLLASIEDICNADQNRGLVEEFLSNLTRTQTGITSHAAFEQIPRAAFSGTYRKHDVSLTSSSQGLKQLSVMEVQLLLAHLQVCAEPLRQLPELVERFRAAFA